MILPHGEKSGFTLIELLVVLGIISVLAALSVSAVTTGITRARQAECASNLRQIGTGLLLYATDNGGVLPETSHTGQTNRSWIYTVAPYLGDVDEIRISPADPNAKRRRAEGGTSYTLNSIVFNPSYDAVGQIVTRFNRLPLIPKPSQTLLATTVSDRKFGVGADHTHSEEWRSWGAVLVDITPDRHGGNGRDRSQGRSNYLYADGHVATISAADLKATLDRGSNPAMPPE